MSQLRPEERWAAACIEAALPGVTAQKHDDGSRPGMHDLDLIQDGSIFAACEVTAAADSRAIELWNLVNGRDETWTEPDLVGGWRLTVSVECNVKRLQQKAPGLLQRLELNELDSSARSEIQALGVKRFHQYNTNNPGSIYVTLEQEVQFRWAFVGDTGDSLVDWFDAWIRTSEQAHNVEKVRKAGYPEGHLLVLIPAFPSAPFSASNLLMRPDPPLPTRAPTLPDGLTHLWLMSTWDSGMLLHWSATGWARFSKARYLTA
jgi:hypothetical protein